MSSSDQVAGGRGDEVQRLGRYLLLKLLAAGGMAEIYLARHVGIEGFTKLLVIKRIHKHLAIDHRFVDMFFDEARIAARLSHPNIVQIFDLGRAAGYPFIAMEYVEGVSLHDLIARHSERAAPPMPWPLVCFIAARACEGLAHAHALKDEAGTLVDLVHRDISPHNLLVSFEGVPKIVDFGIARASIRIEQTQSYSRKGKLRYMSPEQALGLPLDCRSDLFSLGIVLWELLTNQRLFDAEGELGVMKQVTSGSIPDPSPPGGKVPPAVIAAVQKALSREPDDRFADARTMGEAFEAALATADRRPNAKQLADYLATICGEQIATAAAETTHLLSLDVSALAKDAEAEASAPGGRRAATTGRLSLAVWGLGTALAFALGAIGLYLSGVVRLSSAADVTPVVAPPAVSEAAQPTPSPPPVETPSIAPARLQIKTVAGGRIFVDGKDLGRGPNLGPLELAPGEHRVRVEKAGLKAAERTVRAAAGELETIELQPTAAVVQTGYLTFNAMPWAVVYLGERQLGETPLVRLKLPVGKHKLRVLPMGKGPAQEFNVEIQAGQLTLKTVNL